jgi:hypothetical protein
MTSLNYVMMYSLVTSSSWFSIRDKVRALNS